MARNDGVVVSMKASYIVSVDEEGDEPPAPEVTEPEIDFKRDAGGNIMFEPDVHTGELVIVSDEGEMDKRRIRDRLNETNQAAKRLLFGFVQSKLGLVKAVGRFMPLKRLRQNRWLILVGLLCVLLGHHIGDPGFTYWAFNEGIMSTRLAIIFGGVAFIGGWLAFWMFIPDGSAAFLDEISEEEGDENDGNT